MKTGDKVRIVYGKNKGNEGLIVIHQQKSFMGSNIYTKVTIQLDNGFTIEDVLGNCKKI